MNLEKAIEIAVSAHKGQVDKAGQPYILHPLRLMFQMDTEAERIVAVLHDVVEDAAQDWNFQLLEKAGFDDEIIDALRLLTRDDSKTRYIDYVKRVRENPIARKVKLADLQDNMDLRRLSEFTDKDLGRIRKYAEAYSILIENETHSATPRFLDALNYAVRLHGTDVRKGASIPYVSHLLGVCALVLSDGGTEDEAIAALLHDALEDHPEETSREIIAERFGEKVFAIVEACTDTPADYAGGEKPPWKQRKTEYLRHLEKATSEQLRVALADKLDNVRCLLADYRQIDAKVWKRFNAGKEDQLWFFRRLIEVFHTAGAKGFLIVEFKRAVSELEREAGAS
jgi:(p)ppGpp synthase/HD superfamily hydrolase